MKTITHTWRKFQKPGAMWFFLAMKVVRYQVNYIVNISKQPLIILIICLHKSCNIATWQFQLSAKVQLQLHKPNNSKLWIVLFKEIPIIT